MGIKLELEVDEVNAALIGLTKLPYEVSAPIIDKVRTQAMPQANPPQEAANQAVEAVDPSPQLLTE